MWFRALIYVNIDNAFKFIDDFWEKTVAFLVAACIHSSMYFKMFDSVHEWVCLFYFAWRSSHDCFSIGNFVLMSHEPNFVVIRLFLRASLVLRATKGNKSGLPEKLCSTSTPYAWVSKLVLGLAPCYLGDKRPLLQAA